MLLTIFLAIIICAAVTLMLIAGVAFVQNARMFSSAPKEAREVLQPRNEELFYGARTIGWVMMIISALVILGAVVTAIWDGIRSGYSFAQFFVRFLSIFTAFKVYDMVFIDGFLLCKSHFFQYYYPEVEPVFNGRKYGFNIKSQLLRLLVIYPAVSALIAWACTQF